MLAIGMIVSGAAGYAATVDRPILTDSSESASVPEPLAHASERMAAMTGYSCTLYQTVTMDGGTDNGVIVRGSCAVDGARFYAEFHVIVDGGSETVTKILTDGIHAFVGTEVSPDWVETTTLPGFGFDPISARTFPRLLRRLDGAAEIAPASIDGVSYRRFAGTGSPVDWPAVGESSLMSRTSPIAIEVWLAPDGSVRRLIGRGSAESATFETMIDFAAPGVVAIPTLPPTANLQ
jgi:hypothetical protein